MPSVTGVSAVDSLPDEDGNTTLLGDKASTGRLGDKLFGGAAAGAGVVVIAMVTLVGVFLLWQAIPALLNDNTNFFTSRDWVVAGDNPRFGIADLLWTTVISSLIAMAVAVPLGVAVALFITQYSPLWLSKPAAMLIDMLAAVPSIVYGLWGVASFTPWIDPFQQKLQQWLGWFPLFGQTNKSATIFVVSLVLAIMILPIVTSLSREVFAQTPPTHKEGALALGATQWEMIRVAVLPYGKPGVISAAMLALGRALGETVAVMMILGTLATGDPFDMSIFNGGETFASRIANNASEFDSPQKAGAFIAAGLVLFVLTFIVNAIARMVINRRKAFTE